MANSEIEKVLATFEGISAGDTVAATQYIDPERFVQHNPHAAAGVDGLRNFIRDAPRDQLQLTVVRAIQDGPYVVTQTKGQRSGRNVFFDIFRFENGLVVEHWAFSAADAPSNESGHTQMDGPTNVNPSEDTDRNKSIVREFYQTVQISGNHDRIPQYFAGDHLVRHEPGVRDGVASFRRDLPEFIKRRRMDEIKFVLGQGDFVFIAARGSDNGNPCVYADLYRVQEAKIAEHWGFLENVPTPKDCKNENGML